MSTNNIFRGLKSMILADETLILLNRLMWYGLVVVVADGLTLFINSFNHNVLSAGENRFLAVALIALPAVLAVLGSIVYALRATYRLSEIRQKDEVNAEVAADLAAEQR